MAAPTFDSRDVAQNKLLGGIGYLLPFVPFLACPTSKFGKYCANQGILIWIVFIAIWLLFGVMGIVFGWLLGGLLNFIHTLVNWAVFLVTAYYTYMAMGKGQARELPFIGSISLMK